MTGRAQQQQQQPPGQTDREDSGDRIQGLDAAAFTATRIAGSNRWEENAGEMRGWMEAAFQHLLRPLGVRTNNADASRAATRARHHLQYKSSSSLL